MAKVKTVIDGREIEVERDRWALGVAEEMGISIPTLCHHAALAPYGACRLCVVEVTKGKWTWLTTSCDLPIREGLTIHTDTPAVLAARRMALELLWSQAPDSEELRELAGRMGLGEPRFAQRAERGTCILCGLCVRVCTEVLGQPAIGFSHRGVERNVGSPFEGAADLCIGCGACVAVCPTGHIRTVVDGAVCEMATWNTELDLVRCERCDTPFATAKEMEFIRAKLPEHVGAEAVCPACRRSNTVARLSNTPSTKAVPGRASLRLVRTPDPNRRDSSCHEK